MAVDMQKMALHEHYKDLVKMHGPCGCGLDWLRCFAAGHVGKGVSQIAAQALLERVQSVTAAYPRDAQATQSPVESTEAEDKA